MSDLLHQMMIAGMPRASEDPPIVKYRDPMTVPVFQIWLADHRHLVCAICRKEHSLQAHWENCPAFDSFRGHDWHPSLQLPSGGSAPPDILARDERAGDTP